MTLPAEMPLCHPILPGELRLTSPFGPRILRGKVEFHNGTDFGDSTGTPVYSLYPAWVKKAEFCGEGGNQVDLVFEELGLVGKYLHLDSILVKQGQRIEAGHQIGTVGNTGHSFGAHLHFSLMTVANACVPWTRRRLDQGRYYLDPLPYILNQMDIASMAFSGDEIP